MRKVKVPGRGPGRPKGAIMKRKKIPPSKAADYPFRRRWPPMVPFKREPISPISINTSGEEGEGGEKGGEEEPIVVEDMPGPGSGPPDQGPRPPPSAGAAGIGIACS